MRSGSNLIWQDALAGQISVTPLIPAVAHRVGDRQAAEEGLERHLFVDFDEDVLIAAERVSGLHFAPPPGSGQLRRVPFQPALEPARVEASRAHLFIGGQRLMQRLGRLHARDFEFAQRTSQTFDCAGTVFVPHDELPQQ